MLDRRVNESPYESDKLFDGLTVKGCGSLMAAFSSVLVRRELIKGDRYASQGSHVEQHQDYSE